MENRANVVVLGSGEPRIRDGLIRGALDGRVLNDIEAVRRENEELRAQLQSMTESRDWWKNMAGILHRSNDKMQKTNLARYDHDLQKRRHRKDTVEWFGAAGVTMGICVALTALSIALILMG